MPVRRLVPILCALVAAGCGPRAPDTATKARDAVRVFLVACAQDDPQAASEVLTEPARAAFLRAGSVTAGCLAATNLALRGLTGEQTRRALRDAQVTITHVHAIYAEAEISAPGGARGGLQLDKVGGAWQVAGGLD